MNNTVEIVNADVMEWFNRSKDVVFHLSFLDPPFNQGKDYRFFEDNLSHEEYWGWIEKVLAETYERTVEGGAIYFMQREKNTEFVLSALRETGWSFQNLIIWRKKTSAVPVSTRFGKQFQIIAYSIKGEKSRVFNRLRIQPPLPPDYKYDRETGIFVTDVWDDIRELTSGYFAGDEAIRSENGERFHKQQAPIALLLRIIMSSSNVGDMVFDPFAGTGTTLAVAQQLKRNSIGIDIDPDNVKLIQRRLKEHRHSDDISKYFDYYRYTDGLASILGMEGTQDTNRPKSKQATLFEK
ncbi:MAG: site-specific DNA-methyltransferase [Bacteroidetes bacterium]|nr:site-specific DNA-methyltransferase [Bacteroidota bacterium]MCL5739063.1 site-specific DNA-methyltransferase [Bacteroidota bacterium]